MFDYFRVLDNLSDEDKDIHRAARDFADKEIIPHVQGWWNRYTHPLKL